MTVHIPECLFALDLQSGLTKDQGYLRQQIQFEFKNLCKHIHTDTSLYHSGAGGAEGR